MSNIQIYNMDCMETMAKMIKSYDKNHCSNDCELSENFQKPFCKLNSEWLPSRDLYFNNRTKFCKKMARKYGVNHEVGI